MQAGVLPVQAGGRGGGDDAQICNQRNMLDFNDITMDREGRVLVALSDGCDASCQANTASASSGEIDRVMRQAGGTFLLASPSQPIPEVPITLIIPLLGAGSR